jgi:hypothetical protein
LFGLLSFPQQSVWRRPPVSAVAFLHAWLSSRLFDHREVDTL